MPHVTFLNYYFKNVKAAGAVHRASGRGRRTRPTIENSTNDNMAM